MRFDQRDIPSYAEPVSGDDLREGTTYFFLTYVDEEMLYPMLEPVVFIGCDLEPGDDGVVYFQNLASYVAGNRYSVDWAEEPEGGASSPATADQAQYYCGSNAELGHVFTYEKALNGLLACSLRRRARDSS